MRIRYLNSSLRTLRLCVQMFLTTNFNAEDAETQSSQRRLEELCKTLFGQSYIKHKYRLCLLWLNELRGEYSKHPKLNQLLLGRSMMKR